MSCPFCDIVNPLAVILRYPSGLCSLTAMDFPSEDLWLKTWSWALKSVPGKEKNVRPLVLQFCTPSRPSSQCFPEFYARSFLPITFSSFVLYYPPPGYTPINFRYALSPLNFSARSSHRPPGSQPGSCPHILRKDLRLACHRKRGNINLGWFVTTSYPSLIFQIIIIYACIIRGFFPSTGRQQAKSERLATGLLGSKVTFFDVPTTLW